MLPSAPRVAPAKPALESHYAARRLALRFVDFARLRVEAVRVDVTRLVAFRAEVVAVRPASAAASMATRPASRATRVDWRVAGTTMFEAIRPSSRMPSSAARVASVADSTTPTDILRI